MLLNARVEPGQTPPDLYHIVLHRRGKERWIREYFKDIKERKRATEAEAELRQALGRAADEWERTFDSMEASILILGSDGRIARLNRAAREEIWSRLDGGVGDRLGAGMWNGEPWRTAGEMESEVRATHSTAHAQVPDARIGVYGGYTGHLASTLVLERDA